MKRKDMGEVIIINNQIMNKQLVLRATSSSSSSTTPSSTPSSVDRRQPFLDDQEISSRGTLRLPPRQIQTRFAEVVGGTTAECAAVCCCCPCSLLNLLVLAIYKLPAGLYKKAIRKKRRRKLLKNAAGLASSDRSCSGTEPEFLFRSSSTALAMVNAVNSDKEVMALEEEMWSKFHSSGFLRSASQSSDVIRG